MGPTSHHAQGAIINPCFDEFIQHELAQLSCSVLQLLAAEPAAPPSLYYRADDLSLRALDWRTGWGGALVRYGEQVVEDFLGQPHEATDDPLRELFRRETLANFNPRGSHFDGFVARLSECAGQPVPTSATEPRVQLLQAIYSREQQLAIVQTLYQSCEDYFISAVQRFGESYRDDLLTPCWDKFRQMIGTFLMRFRDPASVHEREWIAIVLAAPRATAAT